MSLRWKPKNRRQILQLDDEATVPTNKLHALLGHYNSDDEDESDRNDEQDAQFKDFMNEIKSTESESLSSSSVWQELWDPQSGQPYYWNTITNELTWDKPIDMMKIPTSDPPTKPSVKLETSDPVIKMDAANNPKLIPRIIGSEIQPKSTVGDKETKESQSIEQTSSLCRKDDGKISFKFSDKGSVKTSSENNHAKTNGRLTIDVDSIIAAIEKEVPPDYKSEEFVPLFRRRAVVENLSDKPKLGLNFKTYFRPNHQPILEDPDAVTAPLTITNNQRGLGYQEKEGEPTVNSNKEKVKFVAGEILTPMVVEPEPVILTVQDKISRLEDRLNDELPNGMSQLRVAAQLEILKDAWSVKKLEETYLEEWLDTIEVKILEKPSPAEEDQVIDMVLEDSESENTESPVPTSSKDVESGSVMEEGLDSVLNSFYTDLATLDTTEAKSEPTTAPVPSPPLATTATNSVVVPSSSLPVPDPPKISENENNEETNNDPVKGIKRSKMSQDMTSLVAKWQKIHKGNV